MAHSYILATFTPRHIFFAVFFSIVFQWCVLIASGHLSQQILVFWDQTASNQQHHRYPCAGRCVLFSTQSCQVLQEDTDGWDKDPFPKKLCPLARNQPLDGFVHVDGPEIRLATRQNLLFLGSRFLIYLDWCKMFHVWLVLHSVFVVCFWWFGMLECMSFILYFEPYQQPWILYDFRWHSRIKCFTRNPPDDQTLCWWSFVEKVSLSVSQTRTQQCVGTDTANVDQHG